MVCKKIEHPLRTIEIAYDELKPFHPFEEEMIDRYTHLHNFVKELYEEYEKVQIKYEQHDRNVRRIIDRFRSLKTRMNNLESSAKTVLNSMVPDKDEASTIIKDALEFEILIRTFHKDIEKVAIESDAMGRIFEPLDSMDEHLHEIFKEYKDFREQLYHDEGEYSIDIQQYDSDERAFMESMTDMSSRQNEFVATCNSVIDRYNLLIEEVEKTYTQWGKCNDMVAMLRLLLSTPFDISVICLN